MKRLWHRIILTFFPGTLEEYYAARKVHLRELAVYRRQPQFVMGLVLFAVPMFALAFSDILPLRWRILLVPTLSFGFVCLMDTVAEHYALLLLRRQRAHDHQQTQPGDSDPVGPADGRQPTRPE